jgi:hypothetical protein
MKNSPSRDTIKLSASRDIPCILRNPNLICHFVQHGVNSWFRNRNVQEFSALKIGPPNCLNGSCPTGHQLPLDLAPHPRKSANLRQPKTRRVEVSFACTQEPVTCVCPQPYTSSPCLHIALWTSILLSAYQTRVGLPRDFASSLPIKILYACLKRKWTCFFFHILVNLPVVSSAGMSDVSMSAALVTTDIITD